MVGAARTLPVLAITNSTERVAGIDAPTLVELGYGAANLASGGVVISRLDVARYAGGNPNSPRGFR
jgi:hypothetical protein